jgi:hypothetical protein
MAAGSTYTPIATQTLGGASSSVSFTSIPSTYTDLILTIDGTVGSNCGVQLQFNSDSGSNYTFTRMTGDGSSASSDRSVSNTFMELGYYVSTTRNMNIVQIMNYANTTTFKTVLNRASAQSVNIGAQAYAELWRKTPEAINSITINASGNLSAGSTLTLYGIASA